MNRIISLNVDHGENSVKKIISLLKYKLRPDICLLQDIAFGMGRQLIIEELEKHCGDDYEIHFPDERTIDVSQKHKVDMAIIVRRGISVISRIGEDTNNFWMNSTLISLFGLQLSYQESGLEKQLSVFSIYVRPISETVDFEPALNWITEHNPLDVEDTFVIGDFNAFHLAWSEPRAWASSRESLEYRPVERGRSLMYWCRRNRFTILNDINEGPTFSNGLGKSYIDIAIAGHRAAVLLPKFHLYDIQAGTYHKAVILDRAGEPIEQTKLVLRVSKLHNYENNLRAIAQVPGCASDASRSVRIAHLNKLATDLVDQLGHIQEELTKSIVVTAPRPIVNRDFVELKERILSRSRRLPQLRRALINKLNKPVASRSRKENRATVGDLAKLLRCSENKLLLRSWSEQQHLHRGNQQAEQQFSDTVAMNRFLEMVPCLELARTSEAPRLFLVPNAPLEVTDIEIDYASQLVFPNRKHYSADELDCKLFAAAYKSGYIKDIVNRICKSSFELSVVPQVCTQEEGILMSSEDPTTSKLVFKSKPLSKLLMKIIMLRFYNKLEVNNKLNLTFSSRSGLTEGDRMAAFLYQRHLLYKKMDTSAVKKHHSAYTIVQLKVESLYENLPHEVLIRNLRKDFQSDPVSTWLINYLTNREVHFKDGDKTSDSFHVVSGLFNGSCLANALVMYAFHSFQKDNWSAEMKTFEVIIYEDELIIVHKGLASKSLMQFIETISTRLGRIGLNLSADECYFLPHGSNTFYCKEFFGEIIKPVKKMNISDVTVGRVMLRTLPRYIYPTFKKHLPELFMQADKIMSSGAQNMSSKLRRFVHARVIPTIICKVKEILAVSKYARKKCAKMIADTIKDLLVLPPKLTTNLINLIFGVPPIEVILLESFIKRLLEHREFEQIRHYGILINKLHCGYARRLELNKNLSKLKNLFKGHQLYPLITKQVRIETMEIVARYWTFVTENEDQQVYLIQSEGKKPTIGKQYLHVTRDCSYYNKMGALFSLVQDSNNRVKNLVMAADDIILCSLENLRCKDWRIIQLRELMADGSWTIFKTDTWMHLRMVNKLRADDNMPAVLCKAPLYNVYEPYFDDLEVRRSFMETLDEIKRESMSKNLTNFKRGLCPDPAAWAKLPIADLEKEQLIIFDRWYYTEGDDRRVRLKLKRGHMPPGCRSELCKENRGNVVLHRLYDCERFSSQREELIEQLDIPRGSTLQESMPEVFVNAEKCSILMEFLYSMSIDD